MRAARFARDAHAGQQRKYSGLPYIVHPARVAGRTMVHPSADEEMAAAAFLHDVVEDTLCTLDQIESEFGSRVTELVDELTNPATLTDVPRSEQTSRQIEHLVNASRDAKVIKLLDRIDNIRDLSTAPYDFIRLYCQESRALAGAIGDADPELESELLECIDRLSGGK
ncbi:HD domain-containing protein [Pirellulales bacterium]|nr:HD domain-containing protein [Pirellulales bacterium]